MFGYKGFWPADFAKTLGADSDYIMNDAFWASAIGDPGSKELQERFIASHDGRAGRQWACRTQRSSPCHGHREGRDLPRRPGSSKG